MTLSWNKVEQHWRQLLWACANFKRPLHDVRPVTREELLELIREHRDDLEMLWESYNPGRQNLGKLPTTSARILIPYLIGFHLTNAARSFGTLQRLPPFKISQWKDLNSIRIFDLGCGTSAAATPWLQTLHNLVPQTPLHYWPMDRSPYFVDLAVKSAQLISPQIEIHPKKMDLKSHDQLEKLAQWINEGGSRTLNIVTLGYVLNELHSHRDGSLLEEFIGELVNSELLTVVHLLEPAREDQAREAQALRDRWVQPGAQVLYPCPKSAMCPMSEKDWCYSEFHFKSPSELKTMHQQLGVHRKILGAGSYVLASPRTTGLWQARPPVGVLVGKPRTRDGRTWLRCTGDSIERAPGSMKNDLLLRCEAFPNARPKS